MDDELLLVDSNVKHAFRSISHVKVCIEPVGFGYLKNKLSILTSQWRRSANQEWSRAFWRTTTERCRRRAHQWKTRARSPVPAPGTCSRWPGWRCARLPPRCPLPWPRCSSSGTFPCRWPGARARSAVPSGRKPVPRRPSRRRNSNPDFPWIVWNCELFVLRDVYEKKNLDELE